MDNLFECYIFLLLWVGRLQEETLKSICFNPDWEKLGLDLHNFDWSIELAFTSSENQIGKRQLA